MINWNLLAAHVAAMGGTKIAQIKDAVRWTLIVLAEHSSKEILDLIEKLRKERGDGESRP